MCCESFLFRSFSSAAPHMKLFNSHRWESLIKSSCFFNRVVFETSHATLLNGNKKSGLCWTEQWADLHRSLQSSRLLRFSVTCCMCSKERAEVHGGCSLAKPLEISFAPLFVVTALQKFFFSVIIFTSEVLLNKLCFCFCFFFCVIL